MNLLTMWSLTEEPSFADVLPEEPLLDERACIDSQRLRNFLSLSRLAVDDSLSRRLNSASSHADCDSYFYNTVIPLWQLRLRILTFCAQYAESLKMGTIPPSKVDSSDSTLRSSEDEGPPLDPYAQQKSHMPPPRLACADTVAQWVMTERSVESILRTQDERILNDKCYYLDWLTRFRDVSSTR